MGCQRPSGDTGPTSPQPEWHQSTLPFKGLKYPNSLAVDNSGAVYVSDEDNNRVLKLPAGSSTTVELPFVGLNSPTAVAVDGKGERVRHRLGQQPRGDAAARR